MPHVSILTTRLLLGVPVALLLAGCASRRDAVPPAEQPAPAMHRLSIKDTPDIATPAAATPRAGLTRSHRTPVKPKPAAPAVAHAAPPATIAARPAPPRILPPAPPFTPQVARPAAPQAAPAPAAPVPAASAPVAATPPAAKPTPAPTMAPPRAAVPGAPAAPRATPPTAKPQAAQPAPQARPLIRQRRGEALEAPLTPKVIAPLPPASAADPRLSAILVQMEPLLQAGKVDGARALLAELVKARHADAIAELARTYDPVALQAYRLPPGTADPAKAAELYVEAQKLGSTMARERFDRLKSWLAAPR